METIYRVKKTTYWNNPEVEEIQIKSRTEKFFTRAGATRKDAFETSYDKCFFNRNEAIEFMRTIRIKEVESAKENLKDAENELIKFNNLYPTK